MENSLKTIHKIISGDSRQMNLIPDKSVHLVITSPPYWQLKYYGTKEQIRGKRGQIYLKDMA